MIIFISGKRGEYQHSDDEDNLNCHGDSDKEKR